MLAPFVIWLVFTLAILGWSLIRPGPCRIFLGLFFLVMALGVNLPTLILAPETFAALGAEALVPPYRWFFGNAVAWAPALFVIPVILFEILVGGMLLGRGGQVRNGLAAGAIFLVAISPLSLLTLPNLVLAAALMVLRRTEFPVSFLDLLRTSATRFRQSH